MFQFVLLILKNLGRHKLRTGLTALAVTVMVLLCVESAVKGDPVTPLDLWRKLATGFALIGVQGIVRMAMAGLDIAAWDALAIAARLPLARLIGGQSKPIPAYNSCGLGLMDEPEAVADEAEKLLTCGFRAIKLRLGYTTAQQDLAVVRAVRKRIGDGIGLMVDYNQALSVAQAVERGRMLDAEDILWLEEPIRHDDYAGSARIVREIKTPVQIGENFPDASAMAMALAAEASDFVMPDLERIGGVSGWLRAAALAAVALGPAVGDYLIASHRSVEPGHEIILRNLALRPLLDLDLRLGEGTGAVLAMSLAEAALRILHEMATFDTAGVTDAGA